MYQKREMRKNKKMNEDTKSLPSTSINWYPGHMAKTKKEIKEKINLIDVVYELIDARMPFSSKMQDIEDILKGKPRIIIMTKYDLCDQKETDKFVSYYEEKGFPVIKMDLMSSKNINQILEKSNAVLKEMNEIREKKGMKKRGIRALILGVPNVGKSTLINRLVGKKAVNVGNRPGVTKQLSWIRINKDIELLDTPGILWPKFETEEQAMTLSALSSIKEEIVDPDDLAVFILKKMHKLYKENLMVRYGIDNIEDFDEVYEKIGKKRGALIRGGEVDYDKVSLIIIRDLKEGHLGKVTFDRIK